MELATQALTDKPRDAYYWRLLATAASFALFGAGGLCLRLLVFPLLACLPGSAEKHQRRARHTISKLFWFFIRLMQRAGVLTYSVEGAENLGRPGQMIIANHPSLIDVVFLIGLVRQANCVVKQSLWQNPFTRGPSAANACGSISAPTRKLKCTRRFGMRYQGSALVRVVGLTLITTGVMIVAPRSAMAAAPR